MAYQKRKLSKKEQKALDKQPVFVEPQIKKVEAAPKAKRKVEMPEVMTVKEFSDLAGLSVTEVISELIKNGVMANINENIDFETAAIIGDDLGLEISKKVEKTESDNGESKYFDSKNLVSRPPVVTIMGHVDHGKTSLLDKIREAHVADSESGGITQHISAYQIDITDPEDKNKTRKITFIDTPGHSAFSALRSHGASIADIVILIVAANDGVMPQTIEVIESAKLHNVPMIVAINKTDLPDSDVMKVKQQLSEYQLVPEDWGGKTVMVEVSAKTGRGISDLIEMIVLQADMMDLVADPDTLATGIVIESHMHKGAGALAMVLIENGTLKVGDPIAIGPVFGKVRILEDYLNRPLKTAGPSTPVRIAGLKSIPNFAERLVSFDSEKEAKDSAKKFNERSIIRRFNAVKSISKDGEEQKVINLVLKTDVAGSLEAIKKMIAEIKCEEVKVRIVSEGIGAISESDASMAKATGAIVAGFRVATLLPAKKIIEKEKIAAYSYEVIYELIDDIKHLIEDLLPPIVTETEAAKGEIIAEFRHDKSGTVIGVKTIEGDFNSKDLVKIISDKNEVWRGNLLSIRREKETVSTVGPGLEAGFGLPAEAVYNIGDKIISFTETSEKQTI